MNNEIYELPILLQTFPIDQNSIYYTFIITYFVIFPHRCAT